jgi:hypothetical protein
MPTPPVGPPSGRPLPAQPTVTLGTALARSEPLGRLMQRLRDSAECLDAVRGLLPAGLADDVRAGPLDEQGWTVLVSGPAATAKLRQLLPSIESALQVRWQRPVKVRVKVAPRQA